MASYGQAWLGVGGHWLPTWLPGIPLAWLMFDSSNTLSVRAPRSREHSRVNACHGMARDCRQPLDMVAAGGDDGWLWPGVAWRPVVVGSLASPTVPHRGSAVTALSTTPCADTSAQPLRLGDTVGMPTHALPHPRSARLTRHTASCSPTGMAAPDHAHPGSPSSRPPLTHEMAASPFNRPELETWGSSLDDSISPGEQHAQPLPLTDPE
jgi:hypothetical protein